MPPVWDQMNSENMFFITRKGAALIKAAGLDDPSLLKNKTPLQLYTYALENKNAELKAQMGPLNLTEDEMRTHLLNALQVYKYYYVWFKDQIGLKTIMDMSNNMPGVTEDMAYILYISGYSDLTLFIPDRSVVVKDPNDPNIIISPIRVKTKEIFCNILSKVVVDPDVAEKLWMTVLALVSQKDGDVGPPCNGVGPCG